MSEAEIKDAIKKATKNLYTLTFDGKKVSKSMETIKTTPEKGSKQSSMASKMLDDKKAIIAYLRGEVPKSELDKRGIKLVQPI